MIFFTCRCDFTPMFVQCHVYNVIFTFYKLNSMMRYQKILIENHLNYYNLSNVEKKDR